MPKSEVIADVLRRVSEETEISTEQILSSCRQQEIVDARHLAVLLMSRSGVYPACIAETFGMTYRNARSIITAFDARMQANKMLRDGYAKIGKHLGSKYEASMK